MIELQQVGKILGFTTFIGALVAQVPQIVAMIKSKKVDGISFSGFSIEIYSLTIQDYVIVALIMVYGSGLTLKEYAQVAGYFAAVAAVVFGTVSKDMIVMVMQGVILLNVSSKVTFVASILATKDTSAMEPTGWMIFVYSNIVRVLVSYVLLGDLTIVGQNVVNCVFNTAILLLIFKYKEGKKETEKKEE